MLGFAGDGSEGRLKGGTKEELLRLVLKDGNVICLQLNTAGRISMNRVDRIVFDQVRAVACTRTSALVTEV